MHGGPTGWLRESVHALSFGGERNARSDGSHLCVCSAQERGIDSRPISEQNEAAADADGHGFCASGRAELAEDRGDVKFHGVFGDR